ncbi:MAG: propionyl-CoA synthetase [Bacteroidota bacterium]
MNTAYLKAFEQSIHDPEGFWMTEAQKLDWMRPPTKALERLSNGASQWFPDGLLNTSALCLDAHINAGRGLETALIYDSPVTNMIERFSYVDLLSEVNALAKGLQDMGVEKGHTVIIYMSMIPQAAIAMLACARIGAVHSVVFGGFAARELAIRMDDAKPRAIITTDAGVEIQRVIDYKPLVDEAVELAHHKPQKVIVFNRGISSSLKMGERDVLWANFVKRGHWVDPVAVGSNDPLYILYTSGTTGLPKGIVRENGGHAVALRYSMETVYGIKPGEVFWAASDVGWVVGHSYIVYAPLIHGATTVLFEGKPIKTPDAGTFWRVIADHKVVTMFTAPTAIRAIRKEDPNGDRIKEFDLSHFRAQFLAGERCDADTLEWTQQILGVPVIDHWWQTESGWPMLGQCLGYGPDHVKPGSASFPIPGYDVQIINANGIPAGPNEEGLVCVKLPLPPGALADLWNNTPRFENGYLKPVPGYYFSGDGGYRDRDGYVFITGRVDDVINVAGHRLSTAEMEEIIAANPGVSECACFGVHDELKGQVPMALVIMNDAAPEFSMLEGELKEAIRHEIGAIASLKSVVAVPRLPKTRSGKILRKTLRAIADGEAYNMPSTIDDPTILDEIAILLKSE